MNAKTSNGNVVWTRWLIGLIVTIFLSGAGSWYSLSQQMSEFKGETQGYRDREKRAMDTFYNEIIGPMQRRQEKLEEQIERLRTRMEGSKND